MGVVERRFVDGQTIRALIGIQQVPRGIAIVPTTGQTHHMSFRRIPSPHFVLERTGIGEDGLRRAVGRARQEIVAVVVVQLIDIHIHAGLGCIASGGIVVHPECDACLHGISRSLGRVLILTAAVGNRQMRGCKVEVLIDLFQHGRLVRTAQGIERILREILRVEGHIAEVEDQQRILTGTRETCVSLRPEFLLVRHGRVRQLLDQQIGSGDATIASVPQVRHRGRLAVQCARNGCLNGGSLRPVVRPGVFMHIRPVIELDALPELNVEQAVQ